MAVRLTSGLQTLPLAVLQQADGRPPVVVVVAVVVLVAARAAVAHMLSVVDTLLHAVRGSGVEHTAGCAAVAAEDDVVVAGARAEPFAAKGTKTSRGTATVGHTIWNFKKRRMHV